MKKLISIILIVLVILTIILAATSRAAEKTDLYNTSPSVKYDEVLDLEGRNIVYYYQATCTYCNSIKDQVTDFAQLLEGEGVETNLVLVDMVDSYNKPAWYDWESHNAKYGEDTSPSLNPDYISDPDLMNSIEDIKITGTPTMILVDDGNVEEYKVGADVFDILEQVNEEEGLNYQFDRSKYGKS